MTTMIRGVSMQGRRFLVKEPSRRCISFADLTVDKNPSRERFDSQPAKQDLTFGSTMTDHMLQIPFDNGNWGAPKIIPYGDLSMSPAASVLHYGVACFEGMKVYKTIPDEEIRLFRPDCNMERLSGSMERLNMPGFDFDRNELVKCIAELVRIDQDWIPTGEGYSLYLRPTVIATSKVLRVEAPANLLLYVICSPVGPYYKTGFAPVRLTADTPYVRAWPGGTGNAKVCGNYAPTLKAQTEAVKSGYGQVIWLFGENDEITEVGAMNIFFFLINKETGRKELVTPPLTRGDILPGVTRRSILELARSWGEFDVSERFPTMPEIKEAAEDGRLLEAFGAGTAAVVSPISCIQYKGVDVNIPATGDLTKRFWDNITGIQYGKIEGPEGWCVKI
jgi:branched-chain amino acid aminotransferase